MSRFYIETDRDSTVVIDWENHQTHWFTHPTMLSRLQEILEVVGDSDVEIDASGFGLALGQQLAYYRHQRGWDAGKIIRVHKTRL